MPLKSEFKVIANGNASFDTSSYRRSIVTMFLSCITSEIKRDIGRKSRFFHTPSTHLPLGRPTLWQ